MKKPLIIFGSGGHAISVLNIALTLGYEIKYFIDENKKGQYLLGHKILEKFTDYDDVQNFNFALAVGDNYLREILWKKLISFSSKFYFPALIHPSAVLSYYSAIEYGSVVMPLSVIGPNSKIGKFCIVNTRSSIDHDSLMFDFSSLAPGVVTGGSVTVGLRSAMCIGSVIKNGIVIGNDCVVGANSYINKDLQNNHLAYGNPAKFVRSREIGEPYLT